MILSKHLLQREEWHPDTLEVFWEKEKLKSILSSIYSLMDKGTKKNIFHKNAAARKKSKLANYLKAS